jgi:hypothetical protein
MHQHCAPCTGCLAWKMRTVVLCTHEWRAMQCCVSITHHNPGSCLPCDDQHVHPRSTPFTRPAALDIAPYTLLLLLQVQHSAERALVLCSTQTVLSDNISTAYVINSLIYQAQLHAAAVTRHLDPGHTTPCHPHNLVSLRSTQSSSPKACLHTT